MGLSRSFDSEIERRLRDENETLLSKAKLIKDLVVVYRGYADDVQNYNRKVIHTHDSEMHSGRVAQHEVGYESHIEISSLIWDTPFPDLSAEKMRKIKFEGQSPIVKGNHFRAGIFLGEKVKLNSLFSLKHYSQYEELITVERKPFDAKESYVWVSRNFNVEEEALYLEIISGNRIPIRTDFSVSYDPKIHVLR